MLYRKNPLEIIEAYPWTEAEDMTKVSGAVSNLAAVGGGPELGDMIAHDPKNSSEKVLISKADFEANWVPFDGDDLSLSNKTDAQRRAEQDKIAAADRAKAEQEKKDQLAKQYTKPSSSTGGATSTADLKRDGQR